MSFIEALVLSFALCVDTLVVSATTAFRSKLAYKQGLLMALILGFCQFAFPLVFIEAVDHWVAFGLLAIVGGKMVVEGIRNEEEENAAKYKQLNVGTFFLLGVATSIDGLAVGIGLGLDNPLRTVLWVVALVGAVTFMVSMLGIYLGKRNIPVPERTANIIAGVVLVGLGVKILIEHLYFA